jgi:regulator of protease activity HflC (stomatin/prohibitin superfamily)
MKGIKGIIAVAAAVLFGLITLIASFGSFYTVDEGERAVILRNGALIGTAEPGLGFKIPIVDDVKKLSVQSRKVTYTNMATYSRDQQPATMTLSVNYRLNAGAVDRIYADYGSEQGVVDRLVSPRAQAETKTVFGQFTAVMAIQERERLNFNVLEAISEAVQGTVTIESIQIEDVDFSEAYEQSVEQRMLAEVEVQKVRQNLEREKVQAEIIETQARAEAFRVRETGQAEADAIRARGEALKDRPNLVSLVQAEKWNGVLPTTMIPNSTLPIINSDR